MLCKALKQSWTADFTSNLSSFCCVCLVLLQVLQLIIFFTHPWFIKLVTDNTEVRKNIWSGKCNTIYTSEQHTVNPIMTNLIVGTANGSKLSNSLRSMGTEMRPCQNVIGTSFSKCPHLSSWSDVYRLVVTCFWVDTKGTLKQVVHPFADVDIKPRVTVLQHDFFLKVLALFGSALVDKKKPCIIRLRIHNYPSNVQINKWSSTISNWVTHPFSFSLVLK